MIKIKRGECPDVLAGSPQKGKHYDKRPVVDELHRMQHGKCCYCQCEIPDGGHGKHVEHFRPKGLPIYEHLRNDWENLLLACPHCNGTKGHKFPVRFNGEIARYPKKTGGEQLLIDPSDETCDPGEHIKFYVDDSEDDCLWGLPFAKDDCERGKITIEITDLANSCLLKRRQQLLWSLDEYYCSLRNAVKRKDDKDLKQSIKDIEDLLKSDKEFTACTRAFARRKRLHEKYGVTIPIDYE